MFESLPVAIGIGLAVSLLFSELFGLAAGGMVVPGYIALSLSNPIDVVLTMVTGFLTFAIVHALASIVIVYGRRRTVLMILVGFLLGAILRSVAGGVLPPDAGAEHTVIGYIIPGLIGIWIDRQGAAETFSTLLTAAVVVRLVILLALGQRRCHERMYWRPKRVSRTALVLISVWSILGYAMVERFPTKTREPYHQEKMAAAELAREAFEVIRKERLARKLPIDGETDIAQTGLMGTLVTPITTNSGSLVSKQTSINPNFASVMVHFLKRAGVNEGDVVAVGYSGSFPAINVAVLAALEVLKVKPVIITSGSSSQWGANEPDFSWFEMERALHQKGVFTSRSVAASVGGIEDRGLGMSGKGRRLLHEKIAEQDLRLIDPENFQDSVETRMRIYRQHAGASQIRAYVNVGGGTTSVGRKAGKLTFKPGLNRNLPTKSMAYDSVMGSFLNDGVPVIHMIKILKFAEHFGFPVAPAITPPVGEGKVFARARTNPWAAGGLLLSIIIALYLFVRSDLGFRMTRVVRRGGSDAPPEPMV